MDRKSEIVLPQQDAPLVVYRSGRPPERLATLPNVAVFPGSFNPLHAGHRKLREVAETRLQTEVVYEISVSNVQKKTLSTGELIQRLNQFSDATVALTDAPRFLQKASFFPGSRFVVGYDTAARIIDVQFYGGRRANLVSALTQLLEAGHSFLVGGRIDTTGRFCGVEDLPIPAQLRSLFKGITEQEFREDVSSSALRGAH